MHEEESKAGRVSKTATITLMDGVERVFPLCGPIEEKKCADGWDPVVLYPNSGEIEEGMIFRTRSHGHGESIFAWIISKYRPEGYLVRYIVSTANRYWAINIQCSASSNNTTQVTIRYAYTGLNVIGNEINRQAIEKMYERDHRDWEEAINHYLKTDKVFKPR